MKQRKFLKTATPYLFIMPWIRVPCIYNRSPDSVFDHELF